MSTQVSIISKLVTVLVPTTAQALGSIATALILLAAVQADQLLRVIGIGEIALAATRSQLHERFSALLGSPVVSNLALVTFWASVGLIAYLICWGAYNILIEARNEVTLNTEYTNRGHWRGNLETLCLKSLGAVALIGIVALLKPGFSLWIALASPAIVMPTTAAIVTAVAAIVGLAAQLYLILALALVTFTPWYRRETFTDS
jgi:hypothetical protein